MSQKHFREDIKPTASKNLPVVSKCLVIVLISKSRQSDDVLNGDDADSTIIESNNAGQVLRTSDVHKASNPNGYNGKELLQDFKTKNKTCYWNPSLVESIKSLEYKGFVEPSTILVTAADIHLENLRSAWGRRVLKAPSGFTIERIGDVNGIEMQVIPQTQFMPLPDAICSVLLDLNTRGLTATLEVILEKLALWYRHMNVPSQQLVFDSLGQLIKDRKVFHTGSGYFVVTPDTSRLQTSWAANSTYVPSNASWLPYHPMYVPVFQGQMAAASPHLQASRAHMRSISCQVTTIEDSGDEEDLTVNADKENERGATLGRAPRSSSLGRNKEGNKGKRSEEKPEPGAGQFKRTGSLKEEKNKGRKEAPVKTSNKPAEKEKEKTSIFSKIFGRKKKDRDKLLMPPPPAPPPLKHLPAPPSSTSGSDVHSEGREPKEKEYATFSAQFPPPEWMWYQQQLEKQKRTENWVTHQSSAASTTVGGTRLVTNPPGQKVTSRPPVPMKMPHPHASSHRKSLVSLHQGHENYVSMGAVHTGGVQMSQYGLDVPAGVAQPIRADNLYESFRNPLPPPLPKSRDHHHRKSRDFDSRRGPASHRHLQTQEQRQSEYDVIDNPGDVTPLHTSNVYHSVSALSPVTPFNEDSSTYAKLAKQQPQLGPLHSTPRVNLEGQSERTAYRVEGHEARDRIYGPTSHGHHRHKSTKSHRSRRKAQRIYSYYTGGGGAGSDISYEYKGKLPNKNSSRAQSRDSGVNCVGLGNAKGKAAPVYENTAKSETKQNSQNQKLSPPNHVRFERSVGGGAEGESVSGPGNSVIGGDITNQAYNSVIYAGDSTNQAYNSVVFGSLMEMGAGEAAPSVMYGTIATSHIESAALQKDSLHSGYYNEGEDSSVPASALIRCQVEINPTAHVQGGDELHSSPESIVDVEGQASPGVREVSGSSDGVVELAAGDEQHEKNSENDGEDPESSEDEEHTRSTQYFGRAGVGHDGDDEETEEDGEGHYGRGGPPRQNSFSEQAASRDNTHKLVKDSAPILPTRKPSSSEASSSNSVPASREQFVSDSGFSSPRNPEGAAPSGNAANSFGQEGKQAWSLAVPYHQNQVPEEEIIGSSDGGHHTNSSDVNMASSEQHSGSTTNGDSSCDTHPQTFSKNSKSRNSTTPPPSHVLPPQQEQSVHFVSSQQQQPHTAIHVYHPLARVVPHPDIYNNNSNMYIGQNPPVPVPLQPNTVVLNSQPTISMEGKLPDRDLWKQNNTPDELHKFEEEQRAKKYGVNGEFEVMGVL